MANQSVPRPVVAWATTAGGALHVERIAVPRKRLAAYAALRCAADLGGYDPVIDTDSQGRATGAFLAHKAVQS